MRGRTGRRSDSAPGDHVGMCVGERAADVQHAADGGRRRVDRVDALCIRGGVESIDSQFLPAAYPRVLQAIKGRLVGNTRNGPAGTTPRRLAAGHAGMLVGAAPKVMKLSVTAKH